MNMESRIAHTRRFELGIQDRSPSESQARRWIGQATEPDSRLTEIRRVSRFLN